MQVFIDVECILLKWLVNNNDYVSKKQPIGTIKINHLNNIKNVYAPCNGYINIKKSITNNTHILKGQTVAKILNGIIY